MLEANGVSLLRIEPVRAGRDDAPYECIAENGVGDAVSAEATLTVYEADKTPAGFPVIEVCGDGSVVRKADLHINHSSLRQIQSNSRVIEIGHTAVLQCRASGNPTPKVHWLKVKWKKKIPNFSFRVVRRIFRLKQICAEQQILIFSIYHLRGRRIWRGLSFHQDIPFSMVRSLDEPFEVNKTIGKSHSLRFASNLSERGSWPGEIRMRGRKYDWHRTLETDKPLRQNQTSSTSV